jgi:REP-associated tyrosine transposase
MSRSLRIERPGGWYHLTARGNERKSIYLEELDRRHFCHLLGESVQRFGLMLHAYVLMENHYHLMVQLREANLARAMQWLNVSYSVWFNRRHKRTGHLFQGRYKSILVDPTSWGLELSRYMHLNPVRLARLKLSKADRVAGRQGVGQAPSAELVGQRLEVLRHYRWSSYRAYVGLEPAPVWLQCKRVLALAGRSPQGAQAAYRRYVEEAVRQGVAPGVWQELKAQVILGGEEFVRQVQKGLRGNAREQASLRELRSRPEWEQVIAAVQEIKGESWAEFRDRYGDWGRDMALYLGRKDCGMRLRELGEAVGGIDYGSVAAAVHRFERRLSQEKSLANLLRQARTGLRRLEM